MRKQKIKGQKGFTFIEIVCILTILGLLMSVASSYYFDFREKAEEKLALATVDATQVKINSRFQRLVTQGVDCASALAQVNTLSNLADEGETRFGEFHLSLDSGSTIPSDGVSVSAESIRSGRMYTSISTLSVPICFGVDTSDGGSSDNNDSQESTQPGDPNADITIDGLPIFEDLSSQGGEQGQKPEKGTLFTYGDNPKILYVVVHGQGNFGKGQGINKLEQQGTVVKVDTSGYAQYQNNQWSQPVKNGTLVKVENTVYVYVGAKGESAAPEGLLPPKQAQDPWYLVPSVSTQRVEKNNC